MIRILYWSGLTLFAILLAYVRPASLAPLRFVAGAAFLMGVYLAYRAYRSRFGVWEPGRYQTRLTGTVVVYVMVFWSTIVGFTNVKEQREFLASYEPYIHGGVRQGYTFHYVEFAGSYERIDSPELNALLESRHPDRVHMVLEIVRDFGKLRAYTVRSVESVPVDKDWLDGSPPWDALRRR